MMHTMSDAKIHGEADGVYCGTIAASVLVLYKGV